MSTEWQIDGGSHAIFITDQGHKGNKTQCEKLGHLIESLT